MCLSSKAPKLPMELPMELVMGKIFTRLPVKSLMRFKCVSKLFLSLICSKFFTKRFICSPCLYMCLSDLSKNCNSVILSLVPPVSNTYPSPSFVVDHDLTIPRMVDRIFQNLRGFMCYVYMRCPRIYNPTTRQLFTLPDITNITSNDIITPPGAEKYSEYFFGYDHINDQYKVLSLIHVVIRCPIQFISSEPWVFVVKKDGGCSWKKVALTPPDFCPHVASSGGRLCIDGVIYYLGWITPYKYMVVSFDIRSEEFSMIQVPCRDGDEKLDTIQFVTLIDYGGKPTVFDHTKLKDKGVVDLWIVEDVRSKEWSHKSLEVQPSQLHLVNSFTIRVTGTPQSQSGKVLLIPKDLISPFHIICYDLESNDMRKIEIKGIPDKWFSREKGTVYFDVMFMDESESVIYLNT